MSAIVISGGADVRVGQNVRKRLLLPPPRRPAPANQSRGSAADRLNAPVLACASSIERPSDANDDSDPHGISMRSQAKLHQPGRSIAADNSSSDPAKNQLRLRVRSGACDWSRRKILTTNASLRSP